MIYLLCLHALGTLAWLCVLVSWRGYIVSPKRRLYSWAGIVAMSLGWEVLVLFVLWDRRPRRLP